MLDGALFVWINAAAIALAVRLAGRLAANADLPTRILGAIVAFVGLTEASLILLGALEAVRPLPLAALVTAALVLERVWPRDRSNAVAATNGLRLPGWSVFQWALFLPAGALLGYWIVAWLVPLVADGVGFAWDDLTYHATTVAWWVKTGTLSMQPFTYQGYYPLNAELHGLWFALPFGNDAHANLATLSWVALVVTGLAALSHQLRHSVVLSTLLVAGFLASPKVQTALIQFTPNDLALASLVVATFALAWVPSAADGGARSHLGRAFLCGVAAGLAIGTKPLVAPLVALVGVAWLWRTRSARGVTGGVLRHAAVFAAACVVFGSCWYVRNWIRTGNPVFPAVVGPFEGPFGVAAQVSTSLAPRIAAADGDPLFWDDLLRWRLNWPLWLGIVAMSGYVPALASLLWDRDPARRGQRLLLIVAGLTYLVLFPYQPFSGTVNRPGAPMAHVVRYLMIPFVLGLALCPSLFAGWRRPVAATRTGRRIPRYVFPAAGLLALVLLAASTPYKLAATTERLYEERHGAPIGDAWRAIEDLPDGSRLATLTNDPPSHALIYPLFGRRWQHEAVPIYGTGKARGRLHHVWREEPADWWWEFDARDAVPWRLLPNLRSAGVDYFLVSKWPLRDEGELVWPSSRDVIASSLVPEARVYADGYAEIWDVNGHARADAPDAPVAPVTPVTPGGPEDAPR